MKTLVTILLAGVLSSTAVMAGALPRNKAEDKKPAPQLPFRPHQKRPDGTAASRTEGVTVATPTLPFRPYQKRPTGRATTANTVEAANR
jgi:hypothetical protein